ncbi:hypothetical protein OH690_05155 [Escherichia coli]|nr:hypothetical protein [Escherichia coli]
MFRSYGPALVVPGILLRWHPCARVCQRLGKARPRPHWTFPGRAGRAQMSAGMVRYLRGCQMPHQVSGKAFCDTRRGAPGDRIQVRVVTVFQCACRSAFRQQSGLHRYIQM